MNNQNRPAPGSQIAVLPIMEQKHVKRIKKDLADNPRDLALFTVGINTNLRASDVLALTVGHVRHLKAGDDLHRLKEKKTSKERTITINPAVHEAIQNLLATMPNAEDDAPLFQSRKGGKALTVSTLNNMVKEWCHRAGLKGNYGSHTLRKTFGYMHRTVHGTDIPTLMTMFNHSSQKQTLAYLCIQPEEIKDAYMKVI